MLRFRVVHSEPKRAVLAWHGEAGETGRMELTDTEGAKLGDYFKAGDFFDVHLHPEVAAPHPHAGDDTKDAGSVEEEVDTAPDVNIHVHIEQTINDATDPDKIAQATMQALKDAVTPEEQVEAAKRVLDAAEEHGAFDTSDEQHEG